jgi:small GTP-binding protein
MRATVNIIKKVCLLGDPCVGKTSLIQRYVLNEFSDDYLPTIGTKVTKKTLMLEFEPKRPQSINFSMLIFDILGQLKFQSMQRPYFQGSEGALIVSDLTREDTIQSLTDWHQRLVDVVGEIPVMYLGNKKDLVDKDHQNKELMQSLAAAKDVTCLYTSAKTGDNVEKAFEMLARKIMDWNPH